jgi:microcystin degradation protein MlrC
MWLYNLDRVIGVVNVDIVLSAKYELASSDTTRMTFAFDACFVWKQAPLVDERKGFFRSIATIDAIECVFNVANSY